jgi:alpha-amylase
VSISLAPLEGRIWKARSTLYSSAGDQVAVQLVSPTPGSVLTFTERSVDGQAFPHRQEIRAEVTGGDDLAEVTFVLARKSRPNQYEYLGTADRPPYRIFWRPPADLSPQDELTFIATVDDERDMQASTSVHGVKVAPSALSFGIKGATVPILTIKPPTLVGVGVDNPLTLEVEATGTPPLEYRWLHDGQEIPGATRSILTIDKASTDTSGIYVALVHSREGTTMTRPIKVRVGR